MHDARALAGRAEGNGFSLFQIGLNVSDMAAALRFYWEVFGFANGGGQSGWGPGMQLQGLRSDGQALVWWMVAAGARTRLELFHHTGPAQRPQPADWTPADHGWSRMGIVVSGLGAIRRRLSERKVPILGEARNPATLGRLAFRCPWSGIIVEVLEDGPELPGHPFDRVHGLDPILLYATLSVDDLADARHFYGSVIGLELLPLETLHLSGHEALWGLAGARRTGFVASAGNGFVEVVQYEEPAGRPRRADRLLSDQGIINIGLFARYPSRVQKLIDALDAEERPPASLITGPGVLGTYILDEGREVEFFACPPEMEAYLGFNPAGPFLGVESPGSDPNAGIRIVQRTVPKTTSRQRTAAGRPA